MNGTVKQLTVVSGKGGTGKTTVLASFAALAKNKVLADCDVDAANLHLVLRPTVVESGDFYGAQIAVRDEALCRQCGECERRCRFDAITTSDIDELACEGCGMCVVACPNGALRLETVSCGEWYLSETDYGPMAHARLSPAAESSGRLVTLVRQKAEDTAAARGLPLVLIDGAPGIGCTAAAALTDVDLALVVTEPTLSGIHDMERVVQLSSHFGIPVTVMINKADLNAENTRRIRDYCLENQLELLGELPYDESVTAAMAHQVPLVEYQDGPVAEGIRQAWSKLSQRLGV